MVRLWLLHYRHPGGEEFALAGSAREANREALERILSRGALYSDQEQILRRMVAEECYDEALVQFQRWQLEDEADRREAVDVRPLDVELETPTTEALALIANIKLPGEPGYRERSPEALLLLLQETVKTARRGLGWTVL